MGVREAWSIVLGMGVFMIAGCTSSIAAAPSSGVTASRSDGMLATGAQRSQALAFASGSLDSHLSAAEAAAVAGVAERALLPPAPWSNTPIVATHVSGRALDAWAHADNRSWCAPLLPAQLGAGEGASLRDAEVYGGWSIEFDKRGLPGIGRDGEVCASCGRAVFGIVGTAMGPDEAIAAENPSPMASYRDGSHAVVSAAEGDDQAATATLVVEGQGCVYQVWSFLGESHVRELVESLRHVDLGPGTSRVADLGR